MIDSLAEPQRSELDDLLISYGQVTEDVKGVEDHVEPVVLSAVLAHILGVIDKGVDATDDSLEGVEAVRHDDDVGGLVDEVLEGGGIGVILDTLDVTKGESLGGASIVLLAVDLDPDSLLSSIVPAESGVVDLAVGAVEADEALAVNKLHSLSFFVDSLHGVGRLVAVSVTVLGHLCVASDTSLDSGFDLSLNKRISE